MISLNDLNRITPYIWEIPKSYRGDMRVPARIYASQKLMEKALTDKSVEQLVNAATLPGIVGHAIAMPDVHQGYGFPVGGVAATRLPDGVISPGSIGYDINCISGDSRILHAHGYTVPMADMEHSWTEDSLHCHNLSTGNTDSTPVVYFLKQRPAHQVYRVVTAGGDVIRATGDHPFWTPDGMKPLEQLAPGDRIARYPFEGVPYSPPEDTILVDEEAIAMVFLQHGKSNAGNAQAQICAYLRQRGLLPLRANSVKLPYVIKLLGFLFGDGSLYWNGGTGRGVASFFGGAADLEQIRRDVIALGFSPNQIFTRARQHQIRTAYGEYAFDHVENSFLVGSGALVALLAALGAPVGNKTKQNYTIPQWLQRAPLWHQRLFLAAYFGAELSSPRAFAKHNYNFYTPMLSLNKREGYVASGRQFLEELSKLLAGFGIRTKTISQRQEQINTDGTRSYRLCLILSSQPDSLINLWGRIGFVYNHERQTLGLAAVEYLKLKSRITIQRDAVAEKARALHTAGVAPQAIYNQLASPLANKRFIDRSLYDSRRSGARIGQTFVTFDAYRAAALDGITGGMVWTTIEALDPIEFDEEVYDFTVAHDDHNFVANGFVVSNCGVRLLASDLHFEEAEPYLDDLATALYKNCPSGVGEGGVIRLRDKEMDDILGDGAHWCRARGYANDHDVLHSEETGRIPGANPSGVSQHARDRGRNQLGTLGSGNHFLEVDQVVAVYDEDAAEAFGLHPGQLVVLIHCGSRGLGHQVCTDYVRDFQKALQRYNIQLPDRELVCAPMNSPEGEAYLGAMRAAANYAFANRQVLASLVRQSFEEVFADSGLPYEMRQVYDVAHNIGKVEWHEVGGRRMQVCVHRKGATRAFAPGSEDIPPDYQPVGQPVLVPGSMGTASYVLAGTVGAMQQTFGSTCHGAGRNLSRTAAKKQVRGETLKQELNRRGIAVRAGSLSGLAEEAPLAYKQVEEVIEVVEGAGIARAVARLEPLAVIKG
jgi:tRNA-splicing ligase RtcB